ncbi:MAG: hypothetical protein WDZ59_02855 [Pirellulales bacterium]
MGRNYAGIMGALAWVVVVVRGIKDGGSAQSVMTAATVSVIAFAALGWIVGSMAQWIVDQSVRDQWARQQGSASGDSNNQHGTAHGRAA